MLFVLEIVIAACIGTALITTHAGTAARQTMYLAD
jgi:hypothetical protein